MLREVEAAYNDQVLARAVERYGLTPDHLVPIDSNTDVVHEVERDDQPYILKLIHSSQASQDMICGEVDWADYLARNGTPTSRPLRSRRGNLVETIEVEDSFFTAVAYEKAPGVHVGYEENVHNADLFATCGRVVGQIHRLSKDYVPSDPAWQRPDWREIARRERYPPELAPLWDKRQHIVAHLETLPQGRDDYGLIHGDFHAYNFVVHDGRITVFDFGECNYAWFAYEIAITLYHVLDLPYLGDDYDGFGRFFMAHFMPAYLQENWLHPRWEAEMPALLRLREIHIYSYIYNNWDYWTDPVADRWMAACRQRIENDVPIADIEYRFR